MLSRQTPAARRVATLALGALLAVGAVSISNSPAFGQTPSTTPKNLPMLPPVPPPSKTAHSAWFEYMIAVGLLALVVGINVLPSKRGHQD